jgi:hypothetical protein
LHANRGLNIEITPALAERQGGIAEIANERTGFWNSCVEVNYTFWPNGTHAGLNQVLLTPGLILGRFKLAERENLIIGAGYHRRYLACDFGDQSRERD